MTTPYVSENVEKLDYSYIAYGIKNYTVLLESRLLAPYKTKHAIPYNAEIVLLGIYLREIEIYGNSKLVYRFSFQNWACPDARQ